MKHDERRIVVRELQATPIPLRGLNRATILQLEDFDGNRHAVSAVVTDIANDGCVRTDGPCKLDDVVAVVTPRTLAQRARGEERIGHTHRGVEVIGEMGMMRALWLKHS